MKRTKIESSHATLNVCVFCGNEMGLEEHVCTRCHEYKGVTPAVKCELCGTAIPLHEPKCVDCGAGNTHHVE